MLNSDVWSDNNNLVTAPNTFCEVSISTDYCKIDNRNIYGCKQVVELREKECRKSSDPTE